MVLTQGGKVAYKVLLVCSNYEDGRKPRKMKVACHGRFASTMRAPRQQAEQGTVQGGLPKPFAGRRRWPGG